MTKKQSIELLTEEEIKEIITPSSKELRTQMPHRINPILTEEDRNYLQRHRNKQDIIHSLVTQFLSLIRKQPGYVKKEHFHQALTIATNSGIFNKPQSTEEEGAETNEDN